MKANIDHQQELKDYLNNHPWFSQEEILLELQKASAESGHIQQKKQRIWPYVAAGAVAGYVLHWVASSTSNGAKSLIAPPQPAFRWPT